MEPFFPLSRNVVHTRVILLGFEVIMVIINISHKSYNPRYM